MIIVSLFDLSSLSPLCRDVGLTTLATQVNHESNNTFHSTSRGCKFKHVIDASLVVVENAESLRILSTLSAARFEELHQALQVSFS
jgi:hypothetical protein